MPEANLLACPNDSAAFSVVNKINKADEAQNFRVVFISYFELRNRLKLRELKRWQWCAFNIAYQNVNTFS